ncbi:MAG: FAD-dependent oxidoreductase [Acidobacteria bacterium]|nr:FAD-dependent oxidoreductase [Acidobacteriota bacterium]
MNENKKDMSNNLPSQRREFIKKMGGGALATVAAGSLSSIGCSSRAQDPDWSATYDWICVGSGIAGCAAAIAGHDKGMKTLLIERQDKFGGTTAQSGGILWVPMNALMKQEGISDSRDEALAYVAYVGGGYSRPEYREAYVDHAARVWDYLRDKADFKFRMGGTEFYYPVSPGSKGRGRLVTPEPFPAETLGAWRDRVHLSVFIRGFSEALANEEITYTESFGPNRLNQPAVAIWRKKLGADKVDAIIKKDEATRLGGAALVAYAIRALAKRGVEMRTGTSAERLLMNGSGVIGVTVRQNGKEQHLRAKKGVLLALGGDVDGRGGHGETESWALGAAAGGRIAATSVIVPMITLPSPDDKFPNGAPFGRSNKEAGLRHSVIVNRFGSRFGDESFFQDFGGKIKDFETMGQHRFKNFPCFLVFDQNCLDTESFVGMPPGNTENLDWVTKANSVAELAAKMKLPADKLQATLARFNEYARKGKDPEFNRKRHTMGTVEKPPFYGAEMNAPDPFFAETKIVINPKGQVVSANNGEEPIPGLYGCGNTTAITRIWGIGYQAGHSLMSAAVYGFLAAEHAASQRS